MRRPGGGLSPDRRRRIACRPGFFLPVRVLSRLFRRLFLTALQEVFDADQLYVGRDTHRVALANQRLLDIADGLVRFRYTDYRAPAAPKTMTLDAAEFIRRFLLHVLPPGFHRIRYYGLLGHRHRRERLVQCRQLLGTPADPEPPDHIPIVVNYRDRYEALTGRWLRLCPRCHTGQMILVEDITGARHATHGLDTS